MWSPDYGPALYELFTKLGFEKFIEKWDLKPLKQTAVENDKKELQKTDINSEDELSALIKSIREAGIIAVLPADGLDALEICDGKSVYTVRWALSGEGYNGLLKVLFSADVKKISHNVKDLMGLLLTEKLTTKGFVFDTAIAAYLLEPTENNYEIPRIALKYLGREENGTTAVFNLYAVLKDKLEELDMTDLFNNVEMPLCEVLADMEKAGFAVDKKALFEFGETLNTGIEVLQASIWGAAGEEFNINSPKQLGTVLFETLMLPAGKKTKTGYSTNVDVLEHLKGKHPIIQDILDYRQLTKLKSTYVDGLLKMIGADGRIHTNFQMTVTATGTVLHGAEPPEYPVGANWGPAYENVCFRAGKDT
jgi:DNA polymerase-1